jgi:hypothetical protein
VPQRHVDFGAADRWATKWESYDLEVMSRFVDAYVFVSVRVIETHSHVFFWQRFAESTSISLLVFCIERIR